MGVITTTRNGLQWTLVTLTSKKAYSRSRLMVIASPRQSISPGLSLRTLVFLDVSEVHAGSLGGEPPRQPSCSAQAQSFGGEPPRQLVRPTSVRNCADQSSCPSASRCMQDPLETNHRANLVVQLKCRAMSSFRRLRTAPTNPRAIRNQQFPAIPHSMPTYAIHSISSRPSFLSLTKSTPSSSGCWKLIGISA